MGDNVVNNIVSILKKDTSNDLTITKLSHKSKFSRSSVIIALAKLDGAGKVSVKKIGMAKVYSLNGRKRK